MVLGGLISHFFVTVYGTYEWALVIIDIIMACDPPYQCIFSQLKRWQLLKFISSIRWENTSPGTEFTHNFFAGIGPLQLGIVLVLLKFES